jgi:uncharacterized protein (TIGR03067 family)
MFAFRVSALALVFLLPAVAMSDEKPDAAADLKALVSKWKIEKAELAGKDILEHLKDMKFEIFADGKYLAQVGEEKDEGAFTVDPAKSPKQMVIKGNGGPNKGKTIKAIYKLDGDTLTVCYDFDGTAEKHPAKFETKEGTMQIMIVYKREKK